MTNTIETYPSITRALISVSDKTNLISLAKALIRHNIEIISTGGTAKYLQAADIPVVDVSTVTGFPEIMSGRVKTLHPKIHGGILARRDIDAGVCETQGITPIDLVIVNLYPFSEVIAKPHTLDAAIENIDIGGPCLLRAAAKNHAFVTVVCDPADYSEIENYLAKSTQDTVPIPLASRRQFAQKAFLHTASYDAMIAKYLRDAETTTDNQNAATLPERITLTLNKQQDCRYGENPHQQAAVYSASTSMPGGNFTGVTPHQGKALSYNNFLDADTAWQCVNQFATPACVIVKHANPCGVAEATDLTESYQLAYQTDKESAFGGIIAFNQALDANTAKAIIDQQFVEVILAPEITPPALAVLAAKPNVRVLSLGQFNPEKARRDWCWSSIGGAMLLQTRDFAPLNLNDLRIVTKRKPTQPQLQDCLFAWRVCQYVKSNAIVYAKNQQTLGIGAGQTSRVFSVKIAAARADAANLPLQNAVMASDAFFPFSDSLVEAHRVGIEVVIQPGGSLKDSEVIAKADELNMVMLLTGMRHFRH